MAASTPPSFRHRIGGLSLMAACLVAAGCGSVGPDYRAPQPALPTSYAGAGSAPTTPLVGWWASFEDPVLVALVERALHGGPHQGNRTLDLALARLAEARAAVGIADAAFGPTITAQGGITRTALSHYTYIPFAIPPFTEYQAGFDASWEIDLWGAVRREREGARATVEAATWDAHDIANVTTAEIVRRYLALRVAQARLALALRQVALREAIARTTAARVHAGLSTAGAVAQTRAAWASSQAAVAPLAIQVAEDLHAVGVLVGTDPDALDETLAASRALPALPPPLAAGVPADLLQTRPDVRAAERRLAAATAEVGVARADLYPRLSLSGNFGLDSVNRSRFATRRALTWGIGPSVRWNIIDWGLVRSQIHVADRRVDEAFITFEQAVLAAEQEVADALVMIDEGQQARTHTQEALAEARRLAAIEESLSRQGLSEAIAIQDRTLSVLSAEDADIQAQGQVLTAVVALAKALGGGWDGRAGTPPAATATAPPAPPPPPTTTARTSP